MEALVEGNTFKSFKELKIIISEYEKCQHQKLWVRDSRTIKSAAKTIKRYLHPDIVYYNITYSCIHGGMQFKSKSSGKRQSTTFKMDCKFFIKLRASEDGQSLQIISLNLQHDNHDNSQKVYEHLPQVRKLNKSERLEDYLEVGSNTELLKEKNSLENNKNMTLKDIQNVKYAMRKNFKNDLSEVVELLQTDYNASVAILCDGDDNFNALYFSTKTMRQAFASWPEIIFIDGTYKLTDLGLTLFLFACEDANGLIEVVGVSLIHSETKDTIKWIFQQFKMENEVISSNIQCFMGDKDLKERDVIKEIFPQAAVYICIFHTLKTFRRCITTDKMNITTQERDTSLELLQNLVYSKCEEEYQKFYELFLETVPVTVVDYFNRNWKSIKSDWAVCSMTKGNLKNRTNNCLESINKQINTVVSKNSSLTIFIKSFFSWMYSHNEERTYKTCQLVLKRPITKFKEGSTEIKFQHLLTSFANQHVLKQLQLSRHVTFLSTSNNIFEVKSFEGSNGKLVVNINSCECSDYTSMGLPCRHIFALRTLQSIDLFCENLCNRRWLKSEYLKTQRIFSPESENVLPQPSVSHLPKVKNLTPSEKRKAASVIATSLVNLICLSSNSIFEYKMDVLKTIESIWRSGEEVKVTQGTSNNYDFGEINTILTGQNTNTNKLEYEQCKTEPHQDCDNILVDIDNTDCISQQRRNTINLEISNNLEEDTVEETVEDSDSNSAVPNYVNNENECISQQDINLNNAERAIPDIYVEDNNYLDARTMLGNASNIFLKGNSKEKENISEEGIINSECSDTLKKEDLSRIKLPSKIVVKGRPKGSNVTVIGLKRKRNFKLPTAYVRIPDNEKQKFILDCLGIEETTRMQVLNKEYALDVDDFTMCNAKLSIYDHRIDLDIIKVLTSTSAFQIITDYIYKEKQNLIYLCNTCNIHLESNCICCDSCLMWYHFKCVGLKSTPRRRTWFCRNCYE